MPDDLFSEAAEEQRRRRAPLAARLRPRTIDDVVGQEHLVGPDRPLRRLVDEKKVMLVGGVYDVESGVVELLELLVEYQRQAGNLEAARRHAADFARRWPDAPPVPITAGVRVATWAGGASFAVSDLHPFNTNNTDIKINAR